MDLLGGFPANAIGKLHFTWRSRETLEMVVEVVRILVRFMLASVGAFAHQL